ncbi:MAG: T9SS type A sorting domain-containing protein [Ferruginibacter sp.]
MFNRSDNSIAAWGLINTLPNQPGKTITVTGQSTEYILGSIGNALPVTLTSFYAVKQNASVKLSWETENEINFINFIIERSSDNAHWQSFNQVNALNASGHNNYSVVDTNPFNGINLYRLKQINSDGSYKYSNIVRVDFTKRVSVSIFPNPASKTINVQSDKKITGLYIIDMNGEIVKQLNTSTVNSYDISNIASGIYILKIITGEDVQSLKLLIQ